MKETCLILNRWNDDFARYEHVIDHRSVDVAYITVASHARDIPAGLARHIDVIETPFDHTAVFAATERVQRALRRIDRVIALSEFDLLLAAELRERFSVPGYTASDVLRFRDKIAMKAAVAGKGLRVPRSADLDDDGAVASLVRDVGLPLMVKPRKGAASRGCVRIDDGDMLARERSLRRGHDDEIEMFVDGPILHVDELIENGRLLFARASRYVNTCHAFANGAPLGSVILPPEEARRPIAFAHACLAALDLHRGAFHLELIYSDQGLVFLEVGARVGGGEIPFVMRDLYGVDLVADWIRLELSHRPQSIGPRANSAELGGFLMLPEPVGQRLIATRSPLGHVAELYAEELPSPGHVFDGNGGYETILGRFRFRGGDRPAIERAIAQTLASYRYHLEAIEQRIA